MDKNQTIAISLMGVMLIAYMFFAPKPEVTEEKATEIKVENTLESTPALVTDTAKFDTLPNGDTIEKKQFTEKTINITTEDFVVSFSNKGGQISAVELLKHVDHNQNLVKLFDEQTAQIQLNLDKKDGDLNVFEGGFSTPNVDTTLKAGDTLEVVFSKRYGKGQYIQHLYKIAGAGYLIDYNIEVNGFKDELKSNTARLKFSDNLKSFEKAIKVSRQKATVNYYTEAGDFDDIGAGDEDETLEEKIKWFTFKQRFFNSSIVPSTPLSNVHFTAKMSNDDPSEESLFLEKQLLAEADLTLTGTNTLQENIKFYFGPNDYKIMKDIDKQHGIPDFQKNVYLGWAGFALINKWLVIPLFRFLENYISNYGIIILILVIVIKMLLFPIAYKSYLSMAKMKELKPEIDEIKESVGDDQMKMQQEQMKLYNQVGVSPISGCIPMVLQMPIFLALFNFFPNFIELRHESFLWANDLSSYDDLISWTAQIPLISSILGNHISIFTVMMTVSTVAYTYYNNQINAAAQQGPMKMMGYLMPIIFFFVLNDFAAGLTWYYFISNLITITQQKVASSFIDKDKIRVKMEENKKKASAENSGTKKSGFRQRLEEAQKARVAANKKSK